MRVRYIGTVCNKVVLWSPALSIKSHFFNVIFVKQHLTVNHQRAAQKSNSETF